MSYCEHLLLVNSLIQLGNGIKIQQALCHMEVPAAESHILSQRQPIFPAIYNPLHTIKFMILAVKISLIVRFKVWHVTLTFEAAF